MFTLLHYCLKGTVSTISSDPTCIDVNARFTTVHLKLRLIVNELNINVYNFENYYFLIGGSLQI